MDIHLLTPQGELLVVQVVDGRVVLPVENAPQTPISVEIAGHEQRPDL